MRPEHCPQQRVALDPFLQALFSNIHQQSPVSENPSAAANPQNTMHSSAPVAASASAAPKPKPTPRNHNRTNRAFSPRFDVYETDDAYHLEGDLPGVADKKSIGIEFSDVRTLLVRGRVDRSLPKPVPAKESARKSLNPTVEDTDDEDDYAVVGKKGEEEEEKEEKVVSVEEEPARKVWLSERTFGTFQRTFTFPTPVDLESVVARLDNGLLVIEVPKVKFGGIKKIEIE